MTKEQFNIITMGLVNPSRIKVAVNKDFDFLLSFDNTNDTMEWFKTNSKKLEENLRAQKLQWAYIIETCPKDEPFIYMLISPTMCSFTAQKLTERAMNTLPDDRTMYVSSGPFHAFNIDQYDKTPTTLSELFEEHASCVIKVTEV